MNYENDIVENRTLVHIPVHNETSFKSDHMPDSYPIYGDDFHSENNGVSTSTMPYEDYLEAYYADFDKNYAGVAYADFLKTHYHFHILPFEVVVLGHIRPFLIILTTLANLLVIGVFMSKKSRAKATNLLFVSIAISDTLTGLVLLPNSFHIYSENREFVNERWCRFSMVMRYYLSRVFHTVSVWQTVFLSVQRFVCVCHPFISTRICTLYKTIIVIGLMYVSAFILHIYHMVDDRIWNKQCSWYVEEPCERTCVYMWFSTFLQHFVPAVVLVYLTARTIYALRKSSRRVSVSGMSSATKRQSRDKLISMTAVFIVIVFLVPEVPFGIYKLILTTRMHVNIDLDTDSNHVLFAIYEILLIISFHFNFWIYCVMMREFRDKIITIFSFGYYKQYIRDRTDSMSSSSRQGTRRSALSRTSSNASSRHRFIIRNTPLPSTASDVNSTLTPPPADFGKFHPFRQTSVMSTDTCIPLLTQTSIEESKTDKPQGQTALSKTSDYNSWGEADKHSHSDCDANTEFQQKDDIDDVFL